jgi:hypothetical protein
MSDIKFSCPACGQHLAGDARYAGIQINCPSCQKPFIVTAAPVAAPVVAAAPLVEAPRPATFVARATSPPPTTAPSRPISGPARTSKLAIASLVCSIGSFIIPFGFIPGILCGHMARKRIARDATLGGRGLAKAGLIVGYVALVAVLAVVGFATLAGVRVAQQMRVPPGQAQPMMRGERSRIPRQAGRPAEPAAEGGLADTTPDAAGWTLQLKSAKTPAGPVTGRIKGRDFNSEKVSLENGFLSFRQGADFFADLEMSVGLSVNFPAELSGKTFTVPIPKQESGGNPNIWMKWKSNGKDVPEQKSWMEGYAMQLEFGRMLNGKLPGKIYLCVPDEEKSFIRGTFEVTLRREFGRSAATPNGTAPIRPQRK